MHRKAILAILGVILVGGVVGRGTRRSARSVASDDNHLDEDGDFFNDMSAKFRTYGSGKTSSCHEFKEPKVPKSLPKWAQKSAAKLRKDKSVSELSGGRILFGKSGVFKKKQEIVIKSCSAEGLELAVAKTVPRPRWGSASPEIHIYFDCGAKYERHVIYVRKELSFGNPSPKTGGTYKLYAPKFNVELNGGSRNRIIRVNRGAHLTMSGINFRNGHAVNLVAGKSRAGGWNGAAVLVLFQATVVAHKCKFYRNHSQARLVRYGSGGAIFAESSSKLFVWGCLFKGNRGTNGGAIASSSATQLYIAQSTFWKNVAYGGLDMTKKKKINGKVKPMLQIRGGAIRADSVTGHRSSAEHVYVCNTVFRHNKIKMTDREMKYFGWEPKDAPHLFAGAPGMALWNKQGQLNIKNGDRNLLLVKGCTFDGNTEQLPWEHDRAGRFAFEARGAGNIRFMNSDFVNNKVQEAVSAFDNSNFFNEHSYRLELRDLHFERNGNVPAVKFPHKNYSMNCKLTNVDGVKNGHGDCKRFLRHHRHYNPKLA